MILWRPIALMHRNQMHTTDAERKDLTYICAAPFLSTTRA